MIMDRVRWDHGHDFMHGERHSRSDDYLIGLGLRLDNMNHDGTGICDTTSKVKEKRNFLWYNLCELESFYDICGHCAV